MYDDECIRVCVFFLSLVVLSVRERDRFCNGDKLNEGRKESRIDGTHHHLSCFLFFLLLYPTIGVCTTRPVWVAI